MELHIEELKLLTHVSWLNFYGLTLYEIGQVHYMIKKKDMHKKEKNKLTATRCARINHTALC